MISKDYRLKENEVKKVLKYWKPFFSYWMVLNYNKNNLNHNRFAIIISWKNIDSSVKRNFFRRRFYDMVGKNINCESLLDCHPELVSGSLKKENTFNDSGSGPEWQNKKYINWKMINYYDLIFVLKKQTKLEKNNLESINWFDNDMKFLLKKLMNIK